MRHRPSRQRNVFAAMGVCSSQPDDGAALDADLARIEELERARAVGVTPQDGTRLSKTERAEVHRREAMAPFPITCLDVDTGEAHHISVRGWEPVGASVLRELGVHSVATLSLGGQPVTPLTTRWEELGVEAEATVTVSGVRMPSFEAVVEDVVALNPHVSKEVLMRGVEVGPRTHRGALLKLRVGHRRQCGRRDNPNPRNGGRWIRKTPAACSGT